MALGLLGVLMFAMTLPMTRLAVGDASAPQLSPGFVTAGRAAGAGLLSAAWLAWHRVAPPPRRHWGALGLSALGTVVGFPLCLALALREVDAMHAAVVTGVLPLATAVVAALVLRQRPSAWGALAGCALVLALPPGGQRPASPATAGCRRPCCPPRWLRPGRVSGGAPASQVICRILVGSLPTARWRWPGGRQVARLTGLGSATSHVYVAGFCLVPRAGAGDCARQPGSGSSPGAAVRGAGAGETLNR